MEREILKWSPKEWKTGKRKTIVSMVYMHFFFGFDFSFVKIKLQHQSLSRYDFVVIFFPLPLTDMNKMALPKMPYCLQKSRHMRQQRRLSVKLRKGMKNY